MPSRLLAKVLGSIDLASAFAFLMLTFGMTVYPQYLLFCAGLLALKGLFFFTDMDILSAFDLLAAILLVLSIFFSLPALLLWAPSFFLIAKGFASMF